MLKIGVLGGDGFCGWPTTLRLSKRGHRVCVVDSLVRRQIDEELGTSSLTPIASLDDRVKFWNSNMESPVEKEVFDLRDYDKLLEWIKRWKPDVLVHFAEQRSAPYSMISSKHRRYTVENNVTTTHNVLSAIVESGLDIHLVHLGTMGVYGYSGELEIPEGRLLATFEGRDKSKPYRREILFPSDPGSIYHMTKVLDQHLFYFYKKSWDLRITDLHQGVVWESQSIETLLNEKLVNRFDYDGEYGTVLNRFIIEAVCGHPLTVYGTGEQTRAFIHIEDSLQCITWAVENPPPTSLREVRIFNQFAEVHKLQDLANLVAKVFKADISRLQNPRKEAAANELHAYTSFPSKVDRPMICLDENRVRREGEFALRFIDRIKKDKIKSSASWHTRN